MKAGLKTRKFYSYSESDVTRYLTPIERKAIRELKKFDDLNSSKRVEGKTKFDMLPVHSHQKARRGRTTKINRKSGLSKVKPFSEVVELNSEVHKKDVKLHTCSWAPKSMTRKRWKDYSNFRKCFTLDIPIPIDHDMLKISKSISACDANPPPSSKKFQTEDEENKAPSMLNIQDTTTQDQPVKVDTTPTKSPNKKSKLFPIFMKNSPQNRGQSTKKPSNFELKKSSNKSNAGTQYIIDAGQKKFGATQCSVCGMVFTASHPVDEQDHQRYHKKFLSIIKFPGWKNERVVASFMDGRIIKVTPSDPQYSVRKVVDMLGIVDVDLGFQTPNIGFSSKVAYLFISDEEKVAGCLIAEKIDKAYHLMPTEEESQASTYGDKLYCTDPTPVPTICGISRIWTYAPMRRKKIATRLVEAVRVSFVLGMCLSHSHVAFSDPTPDGRSFALKYFGASNVLVYNLLH